MKKAIGIAAAAFVVIVGWSGIYGRMTDSDGGVKEINQMTDGNEMKGIDVPVPKKKEAMMKFMISVMLRQEGRVKNRRQSILVELQKGQ